MILNLESFVKKYLPGLYPQNFNSAGMDGDPGIGQLQDIPDGSLTESALRTTGSGHETLRNTLTLSARRKGKGVQDLYGLRS